ncbi:alpha-mannosidase [Paenibacillus sp. J2TS4]|uniref:alpha-mannosidase n=1 Tax=Paenibacillus sp. J2TS4 TaxID=2807194 RepID=UPI001B07D104|nr:alpha-mannosidase [Paenibacillus sp. J2TS4]GIP31465.1 alpha-mannosidase [Paenibacillus sp. J2TS4]
MFFRIEQLSKQVEELAAYRYREERGISPLCMKPDPSGEVGAYPTEEGEWSEVQIGDRWKGRDAYLWLAADAVIPEAWKGRKVVGRFCFGSGGGGNNRGFESLLFLNGQPYQGVDTNHQEVFFPSDCAGSQVSLRFRLWTGLNGYGRRQPVEHQLMRADLAWLDPTTDDFYFTSRAVIETVQVLTESQPERQELLSLLHQSFLLIDWSRPGSPIFYDSIEIALQQLKARLAKLPKQHAVTVQCVGHTHIDVAWLWRLRHAREKSARSFATVLRLMEQYPDYIFMQTQPQLYDYLKQDYPELYGEIRTRIEEGRWEPGGAMWLEADCNLPSGESLVRQLLAGTRFLKREFGTECKYLWLPDVFGYSWALPQIMKKSGIEVFMTTKISWNQYNRMPHDTFYWRGIDGTDILTHFITTPDPGGGEGAFYYTYNGGVTPYSVTGIWDGYRDKEINQELLLCYGYGDGGGGVNREMLEMRRRLAELPGVPQVTTGRADEYFGRLQDRVAAAEEYVHTWDGELYLEMHRGTYTSQAYNKRMNRKLELLYREAEWLGVTASLLRREWSLYRQAELEEGWKIILRNQFHDIIPGSSITEVYEDSRKEYDEAWGTGQKVWQKAADEIAALDSPDQVAVTVFNSAPWARTELVRVELEEAAEHGAWHDDNGNRLEAQYDGRLWWVQVENMAAMGWTTLVFTRESQTTLIPGQPYPFVMKEEGMTTPYYEISWNSNGQLTRIYDIQAEREVLLAGQRGNVLQVFEDKPKSRHEAWDIDIYYQEKMREVHELAEVSCLELGPLRARIRWEWTYMDSTIAQNMIVYKNSRRIDFETEIDWHEQRQLLKVAFPVEIRSTEATYDIQFGNVKRPTHWNTSWDYAKFETVGHQWADLSERSYGVSLLNDCKYGYDIKGNVLRLSLIKSALAPDPTADQGRHSFTYSLLPHPGDWFEGGTVQEAWALNQPLTYAKGRPAAASSFSLFTVHSDHVMVDAVKKAEDGQHVVLRIHEYGGKRGQAAIDCGYPIDWWQEGNLLEEPEGERFLNQPIQIALRPYEIKTLLICPR